MISYASRTRWLWSGTLTLLALAAAFLIALADNCEHLGLCPPAPWSADELALLRSMTLDNIPPPPASPSNRVADNPRAAALGHRLFFDSRLSANGKISCASCHRPENHFSESQTRGRAIGFTERNTMSLVGSAYSPWQYWDGRRDSLWSQALTPLEHPAEHGGNRMEYVRFIAADPQYRAAYESLFGPLPDLSDHRRFPLAATPIHNESWQRAWREMTPEDQHAVNRAFANLGKAIAAYERLLLPGPSRFDAYVSAVLAGDEKQQQALFSEGEIRGLRLFIGPAKCIDCHNGPLLTNNEFHNTGLLSYSAELPDRGRRAAITRVLADPFNCSGLYSDASEQDCLELRFMRTGKELLGAMRTPSLRNLANTEPFMHKGQLNTLMEVLEHYNQAPAAMIGHNETKPLKLGRRQLKNLESFLHTLSGSIDVEPKWLVPPTSSEPATVTRTHKPG
ncbi:cytochrome-c peroxidase [Proteobacteria bacterium 005FR1]|nr:cytochrome-c peroxidase [Proteobacteria bacterium 005FR1]